MGKTNHIPLTYHFISSSGDSALVAVHPSLSRTYYPKLVVYVKILRFAVSAKITDIIISSQS